MTIGSIVSQSGLKGDRWLSYFEIFELLLERIVLSKFNYFVSILDLIGRVFAKLFNKYIAYF